MLPAPRPNVASQARAPWHVVAFTLVALASACSLGFDSDAFKDKAPATNAGAAGDSGTPSQGSGGAGAAGAAGEAGAGGVAGSRGAAAPAR